jgi:hypothetical protein
MRHFMGGVTRVPVRLSWTTAPPREPRTYASWVGPMKQVAYRATLMQNAASPLGLVSMAVLLTVPAYLVLQLWFAYTWTGGWRRAALAPLAVVLSVLAIIILRLWNVGPLALVLTAPPSLVYLLVASGLHKGQTTLPPSKRVGARSELSDNRRSRPVICIVAWAFCVGGASFAARFFGPDFFSKSDSTASVGALLKCGGTRPSRSRPCWSFYSRHRFPPSSGHGGSLRGPDRCRPSPSFSTTASPQIVCRSLP